MVVAGVVTGVPAIETVVRAVLAGAAGALLGWLVFGRLVSTLKNDRADDETKNSG